MEMQKQISSASGTTEFGQARELISKRRVPEAIEFLTASERMGFDPVECAAQRWFCWMLLGSFDDAWRESDYICARKTDPLSLWDGQPFSGRRVIIRCLHGYGDAIQFLRYARLVRQDAASVVVQTHPEMVSLLAGIEGIDHVITWPDSASPVVPDWDQQIEVMELPRAFRTIVPTVPSDVPYLTVRPEMIKRSRTLLESGGLLRIGVLWEASDWNPSRSVPFRELLPIFELEGFQFYSFQRGRGREELAASGIRIKDTAKHSPEIADTAADLMNMDLLITVDTMAAHLAGALGRRVWVLLPFEADWRWMLDRPDSPWYPTMRLFRQTSQGNWHTPIREIVRSLQHLQDAGR